MNQQLALAIQVNDHATLTDFCWDGNTLLQQQLNSILKGENERLLYLWGHSGSGKTHLLQACCQTPQLSQAAIYLPLTVLKEWGTEAIEALDEQALICLDDIDQIAGDKCWEEQLFHLYNRVRDNQHSILIISGNKPPKTLDIRLPDLRSRLSWGLVSQLHELNDESKINTLIRRAHLRGFELPPIVAQFLLNRYTRNMHDLQALLDRIDQASLRAKRKITLPFVKEIL